MGERGRQEAEQKQKTQVEEEEAYVFLPPSQL